MLDPRQNDAVRSLAIITDCHISMAHLNGCQTQGGSCAMMHIRRMRRWSRRRRRSASKARNAGDGHGMCCRTRKAVLSFVQLSSPALVIINAPGPDLEISKKEGIQDYWEEQEDRWIQRRRQPRRVTILSGICFGQGQGPGLHSISARRITTTQLPYQKSRAKCHNDFVAYQYHTARH